MIPEAVETQVVSRQSMNWTEAVSALQQNYAFPYVWKWPVGYGGVRILNDAMLQRQDDNRNTAEPVSVASGFVRKGFYCDVEGCKYGPKKKKNAIQMHKLKCHRDSVKKADIQGVDTESNLMRLEDNIYCQEVMNEKPDDTEYLPVKRMKSFVVGTDECETGSVCSTSVEGGMVPREQLFVSQEVSVDAVSIIGSEESTISNLRRSRRLNCSMDEDTMSVSSQVGKEKQQCPACGNFM
jgi:hypothetical protein